MIDYDKSIKQNEIANQIALILNGNSLQDNMSILRSVKYVLKKHSFINTSKDVLEKEHATFKAGMRD